jgi:probable rRNA maturation factor
MCEVFELILETPDWSSCWPEGKAAVHRLTGIMTEQQLLRNAFFTAVLSDDATVQNLNRQFRHQDKPTNVLSFPDGNVDSESGQTYLGDIILAFETLVREAAAQNKLFSDHAQHMLVHGVLHLLGYSHDDDEDAAHMEHLERTILAAVGIPDPYAC